MASRANAKEMVDEGGGRNRISLTFEFRGSPDMISSVTCHYFSVNVCIRGTEGHGQELSDGKSAKEITWHAKEEGMWTKQGNQEW